MQDKSPSQNTTKRAPSRKEDRLKAALKANMAKRKEQLKARQTTSDTSDVGDDGAKG
ncbi:MAG: hypothetical protein ABF310_05880 [Paracoccaceae bacterium]